MIIEWWKRQDKVGLGVLVAALAFFVPFCGSYGLCDPWETHYGEAARQIVVRGDWLTLYWEEDYFFSKPILLFWLMALSFKLLGVTELAARLPVVLFAVAGIFASYWGVAAVSRSRATGALAAAALASVPFYALIARQCITDMPFVASMTIALMALARYELAPGGRPRHMYLCYAFVGLATLAKGPLGLLLPGAVVLCYLVVSGRWGLLKRARLGTGVVVFLCVAAPWYVAMLLLHGERFINEFIVYNNLQRATGEGVSGANSDFWYYVRRPVEGRYDGGAPVLQVGTFPWLALFPAALISAFGVLLQRSKVFWRRLVQRAVPRTPERIEEPADRDRLDLLLMLLGWAVVSFLLFCWIPTKFHHYLLPLAPPVAMAAALWLGEVVAGRVNRITAVAGLVLAAAIAAWISRLLGRDPWELLNLFNYSYGHSGFRSLEGGSVYSTCGYAMSAILLIAALSRRAVVPMVCCLTALALGLAGYSINSYLPRGADSISMRETFSYWEAERRPGDQLIMFHGNGRASAFYGRSTAISALTERHLLWLLSRADRSFIVTGRTSTASLIRRLTGHPPRVLNPDTINGRMLLYDGPRPQPPRFSPPPDLLVQRLPEGTQRYEEVLIGPDLALLGSRVDWLGSGSNLSADITLYFRCERETELWWNVFLHIESPDYPGRRVLVNQLLGGDDFPSVAWSPGDIATYHARRQVGWILDALGGEGELLINAGLYHDQTRADVTPQSASDGQDRVIVARYDSGHLPPVPALERLPEGVVPLERPIELGDIATIVAHEVSARGQGELAQVEIVLYLRAERRTERPWRVFVHAEGLREHRQSSNHHPGGGRERTTTWEPGKIYMDRTALDLSGTPRGRVRAFAGMYERGQRAEVSPVESNDGANRVVLGEFERQ